MRTAERDGLLMLLAIAAGSSDAWSYFGLSHSFVANMTGNTVLIGVAAAGRYGDLLHPLIALVCNAVGVIAGTLLTRGVLAERIWERAVSWTLVVETAFMSAAEVGWAMLHGAYGQTASERDALLACVAVAVGLQSGAMLRLQIPGIVTTYITGTWTNLMSGVGKLLEGGLEPFKGGKKTFEERLLLQGGVLACYLVSAIFAGWLLRISPSYAGVVPASAAFLAALYGFARS